MQSSCQALSKDIRRIDCFGFRVAVELWKLNISRYRHVTPWDGATVRRRDDGTARAIYVAYRACLASRGAIMPMDIMILPHGLSRTGGEPYCVRESAQQSYDALPKVACNMFYFVYNLAENADVSLRLMVLCNTMVSNITERIDLVGLIWKEGRHGSLSGY